MAKTGKLTALMVAKLKKPGHYGDGGLLYLQIDERGNKSWDLRYRVNGRVREMGLGSLDTFSLAEARERAREQRKLLADGKDPIMERNVVRMQKRLDEAKAITFADFAKSYIATHQSGWRNSKHAAQWPSTLKTYVYPIFGALPVQAIDTGLVIKALEPIWQTKPETAGRVRGRIESILDGAAARGYRQGENPARWKGHLENLLPKKSKVRRVEHHAALPYVELPAFMAELRGNKTVVSAAAIPDLNGCQARRTARSHSRYGCPSNLAGNPSRRQTLDDPEASHQARQRASRSVVRRGDGNSA